MHTQRSMLCSYLYVYFFASNLTETIREEFASGIYTISMLPLHVYSFSQLEIDFPHGFGTKQIKIPIEIHLELHSMKITDSIAIDKNVVRLW